MRSAGKHSAEARTSEVVLNEKIRRPEANRSTDHFVLLLILYKIRKAIAIAIKGSFFHGTIVVKCRSNPHFATEKITK
jgi:hypothetical protein